MHILLTYRRAFYKEQRNGYLIIRISWSALLVLQGHFVLRISLSPESDGVSYVVGEREDVGEGGGLGGAATSKALVVGRRGRGRGRSERK